MHSLSSEIGSFRFPFPAPPSQIPRRSGRIGRQVQCFRVMQFLRRIHHFGIKVDKPVPGTLARQSRPVFGVSVHIVKAVAACRNPDLLRTEAVERYYFTLPPGQLPGSSAFTDRGNSEIRIKPGTYGIRTPRRHVKRYIKAPVVVTVSHVRHPDRLEVIGTFGRPGPAARLIKGGKQHGRQDRNNTYHNQQFDKCEII